MSGPVVGLLGVGRIGRPIGERLLQAGFRLVVYDIDERAMRALDAVSGSSPADVGNRSDIVIGCLQTVDQYRNAVLGPDGVSAGGRAKTYVHIGTTGRQCVRDLAHALEAIGIATLDAPMSGGVAGARAGTLVSMVSGPRPQFEIVQPCLLAYSRRVIHLGEEPGLAQVMKLVNNMLSATNLAAACEVLAVGAKAGIPVDMMLDVMNSGTGQNSATLVKVPNNVATRAFNVGSTLHNAMKDLGAYLEEARAAGLDAALSRAVLDCYRHAGEQGSFDDDFANVARPFERAAGVLIESGAK
jgi:3-hydroxyisobutyrate dehydrogenase-like beta-hydroxyacid dehydrogenase